MKLQRIVKKIPNPKDDYRDSDDAMGQFEEEREVAGARHDVAARERESALKRLWTIWDPPLMSSFLGVFANNVKSDKFDSELQILLVN